MVPQKSGASFLNTIKKLHFLQKSITICNIDISILLKYGKYYQKV